MTVLTDLEVKVRKTVLLRVSVHDYQWRYGSLGLSRLELAYMLRLPIYPRCFLFLQTETHSHPHRYHHRKIKAQSPKMHLPDPLNSSHPRRATQTTMTTTTTCSAEPKSLTPIEAHICNYFQSSMPIMIAPRPATPCSSTAVALHESGHETITTTDQSVAPPSVPRVMRSIWTVQMVTQLVQLRSQGLSWSRISTHFPGKTGNACRKRYERHRKRILGRISVIEASDRRDLIATPAELMDTNFPLSGHETTALTAFTS